MEGDGEQRECGIEAVEERADRRWAVAETTNRCDAWPRPSPSTASPLSLSLSLFRSTACTSSLLLLLLHSVLTSIHLCSCGSSFRVLAPRFSRSSDLAARAVTSERPNGLGANSE